MTHFFYRQHFKLQVEHIEKLLSLDHILLVGIKSFVFDWFKYDTEHVHLIGLKVIDTLTVSRLFPDEVLWNS